MIERPAHVTEVVLTGGPAGGKSTALRLLASLLSRSGLRVLTVPEIATLIINRGLDIAAISREDGDGNCRFQRELWRTHRAYRDRALRRAAELAPRPVVILYDRGELDGRAWHDHDCFDDYAAEDGTTVAEVRDSYSAVVHLVTAAIGAESAYTLANNGARWESAMEAASRDGKVMAVWRDHPRFMVIDNRDDFPDKIARILQCILEAMGRPAQLIIDLSAASAEVEAVEPEPVTA